MATNEDIQQQSACTEEEQTTESNAPPCGATSAQIAVGRKKIKWQCPSCQISISEGQKFCQECGAKIDPAIYNGTPCLGKVEGIPCNYILPETVRFCPNCGTAKIGVYETVDELQELLQEKGTEETEKQIKATLNSWQKEIITFAVVGRSALGKSSFINLIRDVNPGEPDYAAAGFGDTTMNVTQYRHPKNNQIIFTDLPGLGTIKMTKKKFEKEVNLAEHDFFLIFVDSVIMEDDVWLVEKLKAMNKAYCFVRTKLDIDIDNARRRGQSEEEAIAEIREKLEMSASEDDSLKGSKIFLISNLKFYFNVGDLPALLRYIGEQLPVAKTDALLFFLPPLSLDVIEEKYEIFLKRIPHVSFSAAAITVIPIPGLDIILNVSVIKKEVKKYIEVFGLDKEFVKDIPGVKYTHQMQSNLGTFIFSGIKDSMLSPVALIPILGGAISVRKTYTYVNYFLSKTLEDIKNDAHTVYKHFTE